jgi:asparagine synthase (glutamine-hydrolysing)
MTPRIPKGGFFVSKKRDTPVETLKSLLDEQAFTTIIFPEDNIILAAFKEFEGQGLWHFKGGAVAYDTDLTNVAALKQFLDVRDDSDDIGHLLWHLYQKKGIEFLDHLRGPFGFALWDNEKKSLVVATDPYGIRPVVYSRKETDYAAASRIRTLCLDPALETHINPDAIYHYLFFQAICSPLTIYKDVQKLEPGKGHRFNRSNFTEFTHYDIRYHPDGSKTENQWKKEIFDNVQQAVNLFLPLSSHKKTGCFLSGGTDSSTIAGMYTNLSGKPAKTFSIGFDDPAYNEISFAEHAVKAFGTDQSQYFVTPSDTVNLINSLADIYDEPFGNASVVAAYYCALMAKEKGVAFMLGGDGGDEIFGGNERYVTNLIFERYFLIPAFVRRFLLEPTLKCLPSRGIFYRASRYVRRANFPNPDRFYSYNLLAETDTAKSLTPDFMAQADTSCFMDLARKHYKTAAPAHVTDRLLYLDMKFTITDNDLRKVTQMVEAAGIQVRYPYLDRDLVDFTTTIPPDLKVKYGKNRYIFKQAMTGFLPDPIIHKSKHGMGLPIANWFRTEKILSELLMDHLFSGTPQIHQYLQPGFLDKIYRAFKEDKTTPYYGDILWVYLVLELWLKKNHR